jgi:hypothetical protein
MISTKIFLTNLPVSLITFLAASWQYACTDRVIITTRFRGALFILTFFDAKNRYLEGYFLQSNVEKSFCTLMAVF